MISSLRRKRSHDYELGKSLIQSIKDIKDVDEYVVLLGQALGDSLYGLVWLDYLKEQMGNRKTLTVVCCQEYEWLVKRYRCIDRTILLPSRECFRKVNAILSDAELIAEGHKFGIFAGSPYFVRYPKDELLETYCSDGHSVMRSRFGLAHDLRPTPLPLPQPSPNRNRERVAILNPYSYSQPVQDTTFFELVADHLSTCGYQVYTNVVDGQQAIKGTVGLRCSCEEFYILCCKATLIVAMRSGLLDLVTWSGIDIFAIYVNGIRFLERNTLRAWSTTGYLKEVQHSRFQSAEEQFLDFETWFFFLQLARGVS